MSENPTAVVTGGVSGIGRATCQRLTNSGFDTVIADIRERSIDDNTHVEALFSRADGNIKFHKTDISDEESVKSLFRETRQDFGSINALVNNAGIMESNSVVETDTEDWKTLLATNLSGVFYCCKHGIPLLLEESEASIVNVSSVYGIRGGIGNFGYTATKGALVSITKQLAVEFGPNGLRTNAVLPGFVDSRMLDEETPKGTRDFAIDSTPQKRLATPGEIGDAIEFLISNKASFINGQTLCVDGGLTST